MQEQKECPKCKSKNVVSHTDEKLRAEQKLVWQCFGCNYFWEADQNEK